VPVNKLVPAFVGILEILSLQYDSIMIAWWWNWATEHVGPIQGPYTVEAQTRTLHITSLSALFHYSIGYYTGDLTRNVSYSILHDAWHAVFSYYGILFQIGSSINYRRQETTVRQQSQWGSCRSNSITGIVLEIEFDGTMAVSFAINQE